MASSLQRLRHSLSVKAYRSVVSPFSRAFSTEDSLVEIIPGEIGIVSGIPKEHLRRRLLIFSPATQQGSGKVGRWKINFMSTQKWENPLMGWTSTGDPYANVGDSALSFDSQEAAIAFAERHGWEYTVKKRQTPLLKGKHMLTTSNGRVPLRQRGTNIIFQQAIADNFKWNGPPQSGELILFSNAFQMIKNCTRFSISCSISFQIVMDFPPLDSVFLMQYFFNQ